MKPIQQREYKMNQFELAQQIIDAGNDPDVKYKILDDFKSSHVTVSYFKMTNKQKGTLYEFHCTWVLPRSTYEEFLKNNLPVR